MYKIDKFILGKFQAFSDFFQDLVGITNFWFARLCVVAISLVVGCMFLIMFLLSGHIFVAMGITIVSGPIVFIFVRIIALVVDITEQQCLGNKSSRNNLEVSIMFGRIGFLFMCATLIVLGINVIITTPPVDSESLMADLEVIAATSFTILLACFLYLLSCTPKPPKTSKVKKFIEKLSRSITPKQVVVQTITT